MKAVLLDTGFLVAALDRSESHHRSCLEILADIAAPLITCEAVIAEGCYLLRGVKGAQDAILKNIEQGVFLAPFDLTLSAGRVRQLMARYRNVPMDFADACLVSLAEEYETGTILSLDRDFLTYRWGKNKRFQVLGV